MKSKTKVIISFIILIVLIFGLYSFTNWFSKVTGYVLGEDEKIKLAQCLNSKGVILYTSATCPSCEWQLDLLGETASQFINIFECNNVEQGACSELKGVPAWKINGEFYYGKKNFKELIEISGCSIK